MSLNMIHFQCTINNEGQIKLPEKIRQALKPTPGTVLHGPVENGQLLLTSEERMTQLIDELKGSTSGLSELREQEHRDDRY